MSNQIKATDYSILIGLDSNEKLNDFLIENYSNSKKIIITDEHVFEHWIENLITSVHELHKAEIIQLPAGENTKCFDFSIQVLESLSEYEINRQDVVINFGGGVISDLGGFVASIYKRGISFINIPTTLLSQVDASVGGKTGIDLGALKNQIGCFSNPEKVFINPSYLSTLPQQELLSGYAEMLKHGLVYSKTHWEAIKLIDFNNQNQLIELIKQSVEIKNEIVNIDPKEENIRKILNFGHTIGHAIEGVLLEKNTPIPHGYAIAWGMITESYIAFKKELLNQLEFDEINTFISNLYPKIQLSQTNIDSLISLMKHDKKNNDNRINFTLISGIGKAVINEYVDELLIKEALGFMLESKT